MTAAKGSFPAVLTRLWLRLMTIAVLGLLVVAAPQLPRLIDSWRYYDGTGVIVFGSVVRLVFVALAGMALGTIGAAAIAPILLSYPSSAERIAVLATKIAVGLTAVIDASIAAKILIAPVIRLAGLSWFPVTILTTLIFAVAFCIPRPRHQIVTSLDGFLGEKTTRRAAITVGIASAGLVAVEHAMGKAGFATSVRASGSRPSGPNVLLVTFDAFTAEDMSVYGYRLPTTPRMAEFAARSSVFGNFYSACTFTTPCMATLLTGLYPSEHGVYHLEGRLRGDARARNLPRMMRAGGYATAASTSNPYAYFLQEGLGADFDALPDPPYRTAGFDLWHATNFLHPRESYSNRTDEYENLEDIRDYLPSHLGSRMPRLFGRTKSGFAPSESFAQARQILDRLPDGFFLWVHVLAPHAPYLPDTPWMGRFSTHGRNEESRPSVRLCLVAALHPAGAAFNRPGAPSLR